VRVKSHDSFGQNTPEAMTPCVPTRRCGLVNVLIDKSLERTEVAGGAALLNTSADRARQPDNWIARAREGLDLEPYGLVWCHGDDERLLALLGVARQRPVRKAPSSLSIDDAHDPARHREGHHGCPQGYDDGRTSTDRLTIWKDAHTMQLVRFPRLEACHSSLKCLGSMAKHGLITVVVKALRFLSCQRGPNIVVCRFSPLEAVHHLLHGGRVRWAHKPHGPLLSGGTAGQV